MRIMRMPPVGPRVRLRRCGRIGAVVEQAEAVAREDRGEHQLHLVGRERGADAATDAAAEGRKLERGELAGSSQRSGGKASGSG
jgi:hypothetical protein